MDKFRIHTSLKTLKKVYSILKEIGLGELLSQAGEGKQQIELDYQKILNALFETNNIQEMCQIITKDTETDFEELDLKELVDLLAGFFSRCGDSLKGLQSLTKAASLQVVKNPAVQE